MEQLLIFENHLYKIYPNRKKSINWNIENIKNSEELLIKNTYINEVELTKKKSIINDNKIKNRERHVGWADNNKNLNLENILVNYNIEKDLYFKRNVKDITCHINYFNNLKSIIIKVNKKEEKKIKNNNENGIKRFFFGYNNKEEKMEFFNTKNLFGNEKENKV